jgi:uncharacterized protein (UPF0332 family)
MSFVPQDFLEVARNLCGTRSQEKEWRTAVGRAYYAAFLTVRDALQVTAVDESIHKATERALRDRNRVFAQTLGQLRRHRNWCDYDMQRSVDKITAVGYITIAQNLLVDLQQAGII